MSGQNRSSAVMQQRTEVRDSLDFFPTPPWATRALCERIHCAMHQAWDPCCGEGHMVRPLSEYCAKVYGSDVHDYGRGYDVHDFLQLHVPAERPELADWIIFNPPFLLGQEFVERALRLATVGVAALVRTAFLESEVRWTGLFERHPPLLILQFVERVIMHRGILRDPEVKYWDEEAGKWRRPSSATAYCWVVWASGPRPAHTRFEWIPPCRRRLERPGDYAPIAPRQAAPAPLLDLCPSTRS